jgi:LCP family protein required for cell wall assembly
MFEHLDDPTPYAPAPGLRAAVRGQVRRRRRRRVAVAGGVASVVALGVGTVATARARLEPERIDVSGLADDDGPTPDGGGPDQAGDPVTVLVVGVDGGMEHGDDGEMSERSRRTDTMALVRIDPEAGEVRLLGVPRDLAFDVLPAPGRINGAYEQGGPHLLIETITDELGVEIDHYVQVDFAGAVELVDALGGIRVAVDRPLRDDQTGTALVAGCQTLDGRATLALGRSRMGEVQQDDGTWVHDPSSLFGRDQRGAAVAAALLQAAGRVGVGDLPALVREGLGSITVDADLATDDLVAWARDARDDRFVPLGLPVRLDEVGGAEVLRLDEGAAAVVAAFLDGGSDPIPPVADGEPVPEPSGLRPC